MSTWPSGTQHRMRVYNYSIGNLTYTLIIIDFNIFTTLINKINIENKWLTYRKNERSEKNGSIGKMKGKERNKDRYKNCLPPTDVGLNTPARSDI